MFRKVSIRTKLGVAFGAALMLIVAGGAMSVVQLGSVYEVTREIREVWLPKLSAIGSIRRSITAHGLLAKRRTQSLDFRQLAAVSEEIRALEGTLDGYFARYERELVAEAEAALFAQLREHWAANLSSFAVVLDRINSGEVAAALRQFDAETQGAANAALETLQGLEEMVDRQAAAADSAAHSVYRNAVSYTLALSIIAALATLALIFWASHSISSPLLRVTQAMRRLTAGDDRVEIGEGASRGDEIGDLVVAAAGYRDSVRRARDLAALAETDRQRMHAAIANMPIGFCMFDEDDRLIVCNDKFLEIYGLPAQLALPGTDYDVILDGRTRAGTYHGRDPEGYKARIKEVVAKRRPNASVWELSDGRSISTIFQPMAGGWLATHEDISERRRSEARIRHMARHDALTDLPNRILFGERIEEGLARMRRGEKLAVLCLDLDRFKTVNDTLGHPVGDLLLQAVSERLQRCVRDIDTVARFGGDEFAVVQVDDNQPAAARALAQRIIEVLSLPFEVGDHRISIGASVGIALAPMDGEDSEQLLKNADMALYRSKGDGRGVYRFFEAEMDAKMQARRRLELDLRRAIESNEFLLHYQPVIDLANDKVTSLEALLRWNHPERGMVPPGDFIPLAEETGLIVQMGDWILRRACLDAVRWPDDIRVAVNLSAVQFRSPRLMESVVTALAISKLPPGRLELEVTEGVLLGEHEQILGTLHGLKNMGIRVAMDDFGTGHSSISYLRSFPFDKIKIDSSFIQRIASDANSLAIVRAVTGLGTSLGMKTTAEGVETLQQLDRVRAEGCTEVQGYLFSAGRPAEELAEMLEQLRRKGADAA